MRKHLAGLSAAGLCSALVLTGAAASGAVASPAAPAVTHTITLTSSSASSDGQLTVKFSYQLQSPGKIKPVSATYSGGTQVGFNHPALLLALLPVGGRVRIHGRVQAVRATFILRISDARHFSGSLPAKLLAIIGKAISTLPRKAPPAGALLEVILASVNPPSKPKDITTVPGLQVGVLLRPAPPAFP